MKKSKWMSLLCVVALVGVAGCSDDDDDPLTPDLPDDGTVMAVEAALEGALNDVVDPLFTMIELATANLLGGPAPPSRGVGCPDVSSVCTSGSVECTVTMEGLQFDFDGCNTVVDGTLINITGTLTVAGTPLSAVLGFQDLSLNDGEAFTGSVTIGADDACDSANISITTSGGTGALGLIVICIDFPEASSDFTLTLTVGGEVYTVTFVFDGTGTATATARDGSGTTLAVCDVNLDTYVAACSAP